ncbi:hypothetical protein NKR23_g3774 [Pleurostoma richardsiae]|uniref:Zn(2)-C6 fungal-type domain-containing protein n=1 Tax=Pleurostoma richardsiae TaxID=41990 RepID=A0AA38RLB9_9PEZI|nr:hypothetical protein NKR23_g3774 [Pleurostoma richardsiae]
MPSRRSHTNSHHGCLQCKARRVKCDQTQPSCGRCSKKGQDCTYRHLMSSYDPFQRYAPSTASRNRPPGSPHLRPDESSVSRQQPFSSVPSASSQDHEHPAYSSGQTLVSVPRAVFTPNIEPVTHYLLHHYTTKLASLFDDRTHQPDILPVFHAAINRHVFSSPYVHHSLLTLSALHLASISHPTAALPVRVHGHPFSSTSPSPYLVTALSHKASALAHFRPILGSITPTTCEPALTASSLLVTCAFALPIISRRHGTGEMTEDDPIKALAQIISLFQGAVALFRMGWGWQKRPALDTNTSPVIRQNIVRITQNEAAWPEAEDAVKKIIDAISGLETTPTGQSDSHTPEERTQHIGSGDHWSPAPRQHQPKMGPKTPRKDILIDAALKLRVALRRVAAARGSYNVVIMWHGMVTPAFVGLIRARDPLALILLAHWTITLKETPHVWWTQGWTDWTVRAVWQEVAQGEYAPLMSWALAEAGIPEKEARAASVE